MTYVDLYQFNAILFILSIPLDMVVVTESQPLFDTIVYNFTR